MTATPNSSLRSIAFTLHVTHAVTRSPVPSLRAALIPPTPWWWAVATSPGLVGVHAPERYQTLGAGPVVRLSVGDPLLALVVLGPTVDVTLTAADTTHEFVPVPQTVTVDLVDGSGDPRTGRAVQLKRAAGGPIALPAVAGSAGTYRSAPRTWAAADTPFDLVVDGIVTARYSLDPYRTDTRLRAVSPA